MKTIKVRTSYTGCPYITAGKVYEAKIESDKPGLHGYLLSFENDDGEITFTKQKFSGHIDRQDWEIVPEGPSIADELADGLEIALKSARSWINDQLDGTRSLENALAEIAPAEAALAKYKESKQ